MPSDAGSSVGQVVIRAYRDNDYSAVCAVHDRARPDELRGSCDPRAFVPLAEDVSDAGNFRRSIKDVACIGERVIGFVGTDGAYLSWLYVDPAYYGRGIGRRLLRLGIQRTGPDGWTRALAGNARARRLYESEGFTVVRTYQSSNAGYPCECVHLALRGEGMNRGIELHDSRLVAIEVAGAHLVLTLSPAYVHESHGAPGVHSGAGYWQDAHLRFRQGNAAATPKQLPLDVSDGTLTVGPERWQNVFPLPLDRNGDCRLWLLLADASECEIQAQGISVELFGPPRNSETFEP